MSLPIFKKSGCTDFSLASVPQRRMSVFSLFILSLFADIHKFIRSVDMDILSSNKLVLSEGEEQYSWVSSALIHD